MGAMQQIAVEIAFGRGLRLALVGMPAAGKGTLAEALLPACIHTEGGAVEEVAGSDLVLFVHTLERPALLPAEQAVLRRLAEGLDADPSRLAVVGTHADGPNESVAAAHVALAGIIAGLWGERVPVFATVAPLWILSRREAAEGRTTAARCFRLSSGLSPLVRLVEDKRRGISP